MSEDNGPDGVASAHRVFGRRKGKKLREHQSALIQTLLPRVNATEFLGDREKAPAQKKDVWLEVGFGGGEHLAAQAAAHPETDFIGCEPFMNGVGKILALIEARSLGNIRVQADDAAALIARLPNASVDRLYKIGRAHV